MSELLKLIEQEIPEGRQSLQENFNNLEKVAQYCQENYVQENKASKKNLSLRLKLYRTLPMLVGLKVRVKRVTLMLEIHKCLQKEAADKKKALEETKNFTTHSLASVAYQINNLATNFLKLLDLQQNQLAEMESNVNHLAQTVNIHKEKVARREIGVLTTNRSTTRPLGVKNGIIFPEHAERPTKYQRKNIDYSALDDLGHGVKSNVPMGSTGGGPSSRSSSISSGSTPAPNQQPPTPPMNRNPGGSIGRAGSQQIQGPYRTPAPAVAPPTVPSQYASMQQMQRERELLQQQQQQRGSQNYAPSTPPIMMGTTQMPPGMMHIVGQQPPVGMARPMSQTAQMGMPPPSPSIMSDRISQIQRQTSIDDQLPPPPPDEDAPPTNVSFDEGQSGARESVGSPPPPPPPQFDDEDEGIPIQEEDPYAATGPDLFGTNLVPDSYLEKVIAIYDYQADKEDELSFTENSVIYVLKKNDDGWFEGVLNGVTGLFPGNYVEPCM